MSRTIAILLALTIFGCLHLMANGDDHDNREADVNEGRQRTDRRLYACLGLRKEELGKICLFQEDYFDANLKLCQAKYPGAVVVGTTSKGVC